MSGIKSNVNGIVIAHTPYVDNVVKMGDGKYARFVSGAPRSPSVPAAGIDLEKADIQDEPEEAVAEVASPETEETAEAQEETSGRRGRRGQPVEQL
jgi:hypothetical protein